MFFSFLPSEALFPAAFFSSAEAFSPAVLSFPGRSLRPILGPARCGTRYGVIAAHFQTNLRNSCKNRTPHPLRIAPPPPFFAAAGSPPAPPHPDSLRSPLLRQHPTRPARLPRLHPVYASGAPASSARNPPTSLTSSRYPASSLLPDAAETPLRPLPANAATFVSSSCRNHTPTRPRPRRLSCRLPHHRPPRSSPPTGWPANAPSVAFPPPALLCVAILSPAAFRRHHRRLPLLPPSPAPHLPATAPPPHPLLSKKEEPTRPLFPTKSLSLQNMDGPPAKNARKRGLLPAPFRIFAHLYPRHARKTG